MNINEILSQIIEEKYRQLQQVQTKEGIFAKINSFEGNAVGQIGEAFVKTIFEKLQIPIDDKRQTIHDEFDILSKDEK